MLTRYRPRTFALELLMIFVALVFAYPVYVLVNLSLKNPHEIAEASIGPPSHLETSNYSNAWSGAHLGAAMMNSTIITVASLRLPDHDRLDRRVLPRAHPVEAELRHVPAVPAGHRAARSSSRSCRSTGS